MVTKEVMGNAGSPLNTPLMSRGAIVRWEGCEMLQGQDTGWVLEKAPTVCGYLRSHGVEIFHLVTPHLVDNLFQSGKVGCLLLIGLSLANGSHLNENLVICQG